MRGEGAERTSEVVVSGAEAERMLPDAIAEAHQRWDVIERLREVDVGEVNYQLERERLRYRRAELRFEDGEIDQARLDEAATRLARETERLDAEYDVIRQRIDDLESEDEEHRVVFREAAQGDGRFAPIASSKLNEPMRLSQVVRAFQPNNLGFGGKVGVYFSRWWEFVATGPREANTEGGVLPVLMGTVALTLLLSVLVVPLGAVAAIYLREYARQGPVTSMIRIAVNNLAGVPSIVYGVFGLGFFCYAVGGWIDLGPREPWAPGLWFGMLGVTGVVVALTFGATYAGRTAPGVEPNGTKRTLQALSKFGWLVIIGLGFSLLAKTPFFDGFYREMAPNPSLGPRGCSGRR